jgi:hypothetical protein
MKRQRWVLALVVPGLAGCSQLLHLAVRNNTRDEVQICNLQRHDNACVSAKSHDQARVLLVADHPASSWVLRISTAAASKTYNFGHIDLWKLRSLPTCEHDCDVAVQLEPDGLIYWIDASRNASVLAPVQPDGFPVRPGA